MRRLRSCFSSSHKNTFLQICSSDCSWPRQTQEKLLFISYPSLMMTLLIIPAPSCHNPSSSLIPATLHRYSQHERLITQIMAQSLLSILAHPGISPPSADPSLIPFRMAESIEITGRMASLVADTFHELLFNIDIIFLFSRGIFYYVYTTDMFMGKMFSLN